jgi:hypothetical protein
VGVRDEALLITCGALTVVLEVRLHPLRELEKLVAFRLRLGEARLEIGRRVGSGGNAL